MGAAAQVLELAFAIERHVLIGGDAGDDLRLVVLAHVLEIRDGLVARQHAAGDRLVLGRQFRHALLDGSQVFGREGPLVREVVVEAVLDHRADRDLRFRKQLFHRVGQQVRRRMADDFQAVRILGGDDGDRAVLVDGVAGIDDLAVDLAGQRGLGQAGADRGGHFGHGDRAGIFAFGTVGKRDLDHLDVMKNKKARPVAALLLESESLSARDYPASRGP